MDGRLEGRVAVVTGSGQSIGSAIATLLAREGANVVVNSRSASSSDDTPTAADAARAIKELGGEALAVFADVGTADGCRHLLNSATEAYGTVDVLVNNAGAGGPIGEVGDLPESEWDAVISTNLKSQYLCSHIVIPHMKEAEWGRVLNISSNVGLFGLAGMAAYAAAKAGTIGLTFALAKETTASGVTVNCLLPTANTVRSERTRAAREAVTGHTVEFSPLRTANAVAPLALHLCGERAGSVNGQVFYASGGQITHYSWPPAAKTLLRNDQWTIDRIEDVFQKYFGDELRPPQLMRPLT